MLLGDPFGINVPAMQEWKKTTAVAARGSECQSNAKVHLFICISLIFAE